MNKLLISLDFFIYLKGTQEGKMEEIDAIKSIILTWSVGGGCAHSNEAFPHMEMVLRFAVRLWFQ